MSPKKKCEKNKYTARDVQKMLENVDWDAHWDRVIEKVSKDADAYERARAASRTSAARKVFV